MNQLNFIHQRFVTPLFHSHSKYSKRIILTHSVACSRTFSYSNNCACSEGVAACVTVTITPRKCNRELGRCERLPIVIQYKHCWHCMSSAPARAHFSSYLCDVQALILPRIQEVDLQFICYWWSVGRLWNTKRALLFRTQRDLTMSVHLHS